MPVCNLAYLTSESETAEGATGIVQCRFQCGHSLMQYNLHLVICYLLGAKYGVANRCCFRATTLCATKTFMRKGVFF